LHHHYTLVFFSVTDIFLSVPNLKFYLPYSGWIMLVQLILWLVWKERNNRIFRNITRSVNDIISDIIYFMNLWIDNLVAGFEKEDLRQFMSAIAAQPADSSNLAIPSSSRILSGAISSPPAASDRGSLPPDGL